MGGAQTMKQRSRSMLVAATLTKKGEPMSESLEVGTKIPHARRNEKTNAAMKHLSVLAALTFMSALLPTMAWAQHYTQTNLVSNESGVAPKTDPNLRNAWGLVHGPSTPWWVSNNA